MRLDGGGLGLGLLFGVESVKALPVGQLGFG
jgi:hypothetical protein